MKYFSYTSHHTLPKGEIVGVPRARDSACTLGEGGAVTSSFLTTTSAWASAAPSTTFLCHRAVSRPEREMAILRGSSDTGTQNTP